MIRRILINSMAIGTAALFLLQIPRVQGADANEGNEFFEKKIRPLLVEHCFKCHSGDKKKGNFQLDQRERLLSGGDNGPAIIPGEPEKSLLIKAIRYKEDGLRMPPKSKLPDEAIADLTTWVKTGAPWPAGAVVPTNTTVQNGFDLKSRLKHWSFQPLKKTSKPDVQDKRWPASPIDYFILAKLEQNGLRPARAADKRTLIRRVTFDLIGLPPTIAEIDAFLADTSSTAFATVVDRLLDSPHYGERWGRHWLDLVRYAETCGHEFDFELPEAYLYRDYVIRALNADLPYDQFVTEHIAGDLLPNPRRHPTEGYNESILGTGFWFLGEAKHSPVDIRGDESDRLDNQIDVFSKAFLGLTVACARCHDHKFDPISTKDYYSLMGYLQSSRYQRAFIDPPESTSQVISRLRKTQSEYRADAIATAASRLVDLNDRLFKEMNAAAKHASSADSATSKIGPSHRFPDALQKLATTRTDDPLYVWNLLAAAQERGSKQSFQSKRRDLVERLHAQTERCKSAATKSLLFDDFSKASYQDWFVSGDAFGTGPALAGDLVLEQDPQRPVKSVIGHTLAHSGIVTNKAKGVLRSKTFVLNKKHVLYHVAGKQCEINLIIDGYQLIRNPIYGGLKVKVEHGDRFEWQQQDVAMWLGHRAHIEVVDDGPGWIALDRILFSDDSPPEEAPNELIVELLEDAKLDSPEKLANKFRSTFSNAIGTWQKETQQADSKIALLNWLLQTERGWSPNESDAKDRNSSKLKRFVDSWRALENEMPAPGRAMAMMDGTPWNAHVHIRGNHKSLGDEVPRRFLEALTTGPATNPTGCGRLELARAMASPSNPLLSRVMVNRIWQHHFGTGIVRSSDNFGLLGETPSHPELLDFLAEKFIRDGWSLKKMHRLLLLSSTYQMSSQAEKADAETRDPKNRLLHRMSIRRLEAESIRDSILFVSGRLDPKMYGPGVMPYLTPHMSGRGKPRESGPLDGDGRRSIYLNVRRNFLTPMFLAFDYPIPFTTMGLRSESNVPAQALTMMNNPLVLQEAERWAKRTLEDGTQSDSQRIDRLYLQAFGRSPEVEELSAALRFVQESGAGSTKEKTLRQWADLCHVLMNVKEFIFVN